MNALQYTLMLGAVFLTGATSLLAAGKITTVAQVISTDGDESHVFIKLNGLDGATLDKYRVYHKAGKSDAPGNYTFRGMILSTKDPNTVKAQLSIAESAGFDNVGLEAVLDGMLDGGGAGDSLEVKLLKVISTVLPNGLSEQRNAMLVNRFPQTAPSMGSGFIATVPLGLSTFEIRNDDDTQVIGRATVVGGEPAILPAAGQVGERVDATATGHLTVALRWTTPDALKLRSLHVAGYNLYRVSAEDWEQATGQEVPLNLDRNLLLDSIPLGLAHQVNRSLIAPEVTLSAPLNPDDATYFFVDANDSDALQRMEPGGVPFENGERVVYFVAAVSHVGIVGELSPGLPVTVCDRIAPSAPEDFRVEQRYHYDDGTNVGTNYLSPSWKAQPVEDVEFYCVHRYEGIANGALHDRAMGNWPYNANLVAIVPNLPNELGRIRFHDNGSNEVPGAPAHPALPGDANQTFWYTVCAIDRSACKDVEGHGNVGGPSGAVPAALYRNDGPGDAGGRVSVPCCDLTVSEPEPTEPNGDANPVLTAFRNSKRIVRVDFAAQRSSSAQILPLASVKFPTNADEKSVNARVDVSDLLDFKLMARFHTNVGRRSGWVSTGTFSAPFVPDQQWAARWLCEPRPVSGCGGVVDPVDPETGEYEDICVSIGAPLARAVEVALYTQIDGGPMIRRHRSAYEEPIEVCFPAPATPGEVCVYTQTFDKDGNPGVVVLLECLETIGHEGYPTPTLTFAEPLEAQLGDHTGLSNVKWSSPYSGVHRFEVRVTPPLPNAKRIVHDSAEAGVIKKSWSFHDTPSLPSGFGNGPDFQQDMGLIIGETHTVSVRAVGPGEHDARATGDWSEPKSITWAPDSNGGDPPQDGVAFPIRPVPGISPTELLSVYSPDESNILLKDRYVWVEVGELDRELVENETIITADITVPAVLKIDSIEPYLHFDLPMVGYLQRTDVPNKPTLQVTHFIDEILTETSQGKLTLLDDSFFVAHKTDKSTVSIWLRMAMPPAKGGTYRGTILQHHPDRETRAVFRANFVNIQ